MEPAAAAEAQAARGLWLSVGGASDYVVHGLTRSQGDPVVNAELGYGPGGGWLMSVRGSTMNLNPGPGPDRELGLYLGYRRRLSEDWELGANLARYEFAGNTAFLPYDYTEATLEATWRSLLQLRLQYSPDYSIVTRLGPAREFGTWTGELQLNWPLRAEFSLGAGLGHYDLTSGPGFGYWYWTAGAVASRGRWSLALNYVGVDDTARAMFNPRFTGDRVVAALALRLR